MSTTRSYPIINTIISDIAAAKTAQHDYIDDVLNIINGVTTTYVTYDVFGIYAPKLPDSMTDKVVYAYLHFNEPNPKTGFLFFRGNKKYWFVSFDGTCSKCFPYEIEPGKVNGYDNQCLSMLEIREVIKNSAIVDVEWVNRMKPHLDYSTEDGVYVTDAKLTAGGQIEVDGTAIFNGNVHNESGFIETNELKVNQIKVQDTPEGETPTITFQNCTIEISGTNADVGATLSNKIAESLLGVFVDIKDTVPASSSAVGRKGDVAFDGTYLYFCTSGDGSAEGTWKRIAWDTTWN